MGHSNSRPDTGKPSPAWLKAALRGLQICIEGRPIASKIGAKSAFWSVDGEAVKVEDLALQHYAAEEHGSWQGLQKLSV